MKITSILLLGSLFFSQVSMANCNDEKSHPEVNFINCSKQARNDDAEAQYNLGLMYYKGYGIKQGYYQAFRWYQEAANQGHNRARYNIGLMYRDGLGVRQDKLKAKSLFGKVCDSGLYQDGCNEYRKLNEAGF